MMKKGGLNFLNRRNQSLFDTNTQIKELENVEFVYNSAVIPDSGTAKVRARPTVKHFSTFGDGAMGYAVPTPKVPLLPSFNGTQKTGSADRLSIISIDDVDEGQILIPPPPSIAPPPPPPPPQFIPPSPGHTIPPTAFFTELNPHVDLAALEPPSMRPPNPPAPEKRDPPSPRPPPMTPPKPPGAKITMPQEIPECPNFTPPLPPTKSPIIKKMPPEKPTRYSSIPNLAIISGPSNPTSNHTVRSASIFNLQNTVPVQTAPKTSIRSEQPDSAMPPVPPTKPSRRNSSGMKLESDLQDLRQNLQRTLPNQPKTPSMVVNGIPETSLLEIPNPVPPPIKSSLTPERVPGELSAQHLIKPSTTPSYSPLLTHKLRNLKASEASSLKEPAASPFALLMAAKERDKQRSGLSRQNSTKSTNSIDSSGANLHPVETRPSSVMGSPKPHVTYTNISPTRLTESKPESPRVTYSRTEPPVPSSSIMGKTPINSSGFTSPSSKAPLPTHYITDGEGGLSFIPPPPEFANSDTEDETPPSTSPPYPPTNSTRIRSPLNSITNSPAAFQSTNPTSTTPSVPSKPTTQQSLKPSPPKIQPPSPPKLPPQTLPPTQTKPQYQASLSSQPPPPMAPNQATLLSILQKKMLEMDSKFSHTTEVHSEWDDEDMGGTQQLNKRKNVTQTAQSGLNMMELQNKVTQKAQSKPASSSGSTSSKQQFGMTFMVRPGTKQPITPVPKTE